MRVGGGGGICYFYRPQRSCGQGNIFTPVCHSVYGGGGYPSMPCRSVLRGGGGYPSMPCRSVLGGGYPSMPCRSVLGGSGPGRGVRTPHFLGWNFFDFCFLLGYPPPPPLYPPPGSRVKHMVNKWPVCILLECILVMLKIMGKSK